MADKQQMQRAILFADICQSTHIFEAYGNVEARRIEEQAIALLSEAVTGYGGRVVKTIGDEVMCTFESAESAIASACLMHQDINGDKLVTPFKISVKIGLHWGDVLDEDGDVYGDAVNVAARLVKLASGDQTLTTQATVEQLSTSWRDKIRHLGPIPVRGRQEKLNVCEVFWLENTADVTRMATTIRPVASQANSLVLYYQKSEIIIDPEKSKFGIGRGPLNDLICQQEMASRSHASIEHRQGHFVLIDHSTNGTYILMDGDQKRLLRYSEFTLSGGGIISLGQDISPKHSSDFHINFIEKN